MIVLASNTTKSVQRRVEMGTYSPLKYYFDKALAERLAALILSAYTLFESDEFIQSVAGRVENIELKERVTIISEELFRFLPDDYTSALEILLSILGPENESETGMFTNGYFLMPVARYIEAYGLNHFDLSMNALYELTKRHTAEYAIRPYILANPEKCKVYFNQWIQDSSAHVRRLVSEGTRPRLPWAKKIAVINGDINCNLSLLDSLRDDSSHYVIKSVGNHLNDLSKEDSEAVLMWVKQRLDTIHPIILKKGLRTLLKKENKKAQELSNKVERDKRT